MHILQAAQTDLRNEKRDNKTTRRYPNSVWDNCSTNKGDLKMYINKLLKKLLMAATLLALLFSAACASKNEIQSTDGQALIKQGNAYMTCLKEGDWECAYELMSPFAQHELDDAESIAGGVVNLDTVIKKYAPKISEWAFDRAQFSTRDGTTIGYLEGKVEYVDGKRGNVSLEFEQDGETWKVRASELHTGISLGLGK
jgi:opacity protein-like surface antigen